MAKATALTTKITSAPTTSKKEKKPIEQAKRKLCTEEIDYEYNG